MNSLDETDSKETEITTSRSKSKNTENEIFLMAKKAKINASSSLRANNTKKESLGNAFSQGAMFMESPPQFMKKQSGIFENLPKLFESTESKGPSSFSNTGIDTHDYTQSYYIEVCVKTTSMLL